VGRVYSSVTDHRGAIVVEYILVVVVQQFAVVGIQKLEKLLKGRGGVRTGEFPVG
jgi:hypothetical protein